MTSTWSRRLCCRREETDFGWRPLTLLVDVSSSSLGCSLPVLIFLDTGERGVGGASSLDRASPVSSFLCTVVGSGRTLGRPGPRLFPFVSGTGAASFFGRDGAVRIDDVWLRLRSPRFAGGW